MPMPVAVEASMSHMAISYGLPAVPSPPITPFAGVKSESALMRIEPWDGHCEGLGNNGDPEARIGAEVRATRAIRPTMTRVIRPWVATSPSRNAMGVTTYHLSGHWTTSKFANFPYDLDCCSPLRDRSVGGEYPTGEPR